MPSRATFKSANALQRLVQKASFGKLGWKAYGMPVVELTTTGRKSGAPRTVLLTSPLTDGDAIVLVASAGGNDANPAWVLNVEAEPSVTARVADGPARPMRAHVASSEERARLWPMVIEAKPHYAGYQRKTSREIPLVLLEPTG